MQTRKNILVALLCLAVSPVYGGGQAPHGTVMNGQELFEAHFGKRYETKTERSRRFIEYCPDNKCYEFSADAKQVNDLYSFSALYLYFVAQHYGLCEFRRESRSTIGRLLIHLGKVCSSRETEVERARCVMLLIGGRSRVGVAHVTYDEDARVVEPARLAEEVAHIGEPDYGPGVCH